jgi:hypothetical protein
MSRFGLAGKAGRHSIFKQRPLFSPPVVPAGAPSRARRAGIVFGLLMTVPAFAGTTCLIVLAAGFLRPSYDFLRRFAIRMGAAHFEHL